jgi:hypothetical protein
VLDGVGGEKRREWCSFDRLYFPSYSRGCLSVYIRCVNNESDEQKTTENEESDSEMISKRYHPKDRKTSREREMI